MRPNYDGIKYYGKSDWSISYELAKSIKIIKVFDKDKTYTDINEVIELFNIKRLFELNINLEGWTERDIDEYRDRVKKFDEIIGRKFNEINDTNFEEFESSVCTFYYDDFWVLFEKYKSYKEVSIKSFGNFLSKETTTFAFILKHKNIVDYYGDIISENLYKSNQTVDILVSTFMKDDGTKFNLPKEFDKNKIDTIFERYIESETINPNTLNLIYLFQSTKECPISDKTRYNAKKRYQEFWKNPNKSINLMHGYTIQISLKPQKQIKEETFVDNQCILSYDLNWLEQHLDYPTILNNFIYIFELVDNEFRSVLPTVESETGVLEYAFNQKGKKFYLENNAFKFLNQCSFLKGAAYIDFLKKHGIDLFSVFKWFFEDYLNKEFNAFGFVLSKLDDNDSYGDKCLKLAIELESVLKQFKMYAEDGKIDRELFEFSSTILDIKNIPSLLKNKYVFSKGSKILGVMNVLFSDQTTLGCIDGNYSYSTFYELIRHQTVNINSFAEYQKKLIKCLIEEKVAHLDKDGKLLFDSKKIFLLKDLYNHEYISFYHLVVIKKEINELIAKNDLEVENTLFSSKESDYFNYMLNKSKFNNGPDLRNKYAHGNNPLDEKTQYHDYVQMAILMITAIIKINDEFVLRDELKGGELNEL